MKSILEIGELNYEFIDQFLLFIFEIRFFDGFFYLFEFLVVVFYFINELILFVGCLNVILRFNKEVKDLLIIESLVIFCFVFLLENEEEIMNCFKMISLECSLFVKKSIIVFDIGLVENGVSKKGVFIMKSKIKKF